MMRSNRIDAHQMPWAGRLRACGAWSPCASPAQFLCASVVPRPRPPRVLADYPRIATSDHEPRPRCAVSRRCRYTNHNSRITTHGVSQPGTRVRTDFVVTYSKQRTDALSARYTPRTIEDRRLERPARAKGLSSSLRRGSSDRRIRPGGCKI